MWDLLIIQPFTNVLLLIYSYLGQNFGIAIILFTLLIRLITHPLMVSQIKGSQKMMELQNHPRYKELQEKYKNDRQKLQEEQAKLIQELKINPFASCLPLLIQFPIIIGLYQSLYKAMPNTPHDLLNLTRILYSFVDINAILPINNQFLWMDLSQPERLYLPFLPFGIPVLAIVVALTTYIQGRLITPPPSNPNDQTAMMSGMMNLYMPFLMGYMGLTLASGLSLYFIVSNVIGILQYALLGKVNWRNILPARKISGETPVSPAKSVASSRKGGKKK
ncbi:MULTISPECIES: YidC/Oxa1 family membrane protein insertase [Anaerolinea]|uniref:Hypothetical membrane protein n=1 Tax=Anaerolinea thermophila (strain DSM 14523 / JCM 11388 / NBRC 100420 / UNI-1) TaxID=926569 RepID=E8MY85_ANATU|nr:MULTISPECIES: YidC/Oxa1 family membrane protein insertase [Anaerolinea]BAJ64316.1 hypothetical membrane protein [Anaerolinea thermophila UNI-1]